MLKAAVFRRVCSEARKIDGDHQRAFRLRGSLEFSEGRSCISSSPSFKSIMATTFRNPGKHALEFCFRSYAQITDFRSFCVYSIEQQVQVQPDALSAAQLKIPVPDEAAQFDEPHDGSFGAGVQEENEAALQAFDTFVNNVKASGKDADLNSLKTLEGLLAQVESSVTISNKHKLGAACSTLAELFSAAKELEKSLLYAQKGFEALRRIKDSSAKYDACRCLYVIATALCSAGEFEKALKQAEHLNLILRHLEKSPRKKDFTPMKFALQTVFIKCKKSLGMIEEALPHFDKYVKLKERLVVQGDPSLGAVYIQAAEAYQEANQSAEAVHFALKGLNILTEKFGSSSYQVGYVRALLSEAYYGVGLFEECLSEYDKARPILETVGDNSMENMAPFIMKSVSSLIELQRFEQAIMRLEELVGSTSKSSLAHASALVTLARVYSLSNMKKEFFECCKIALRVLESNPNVSVSTGEYICLLASTYELQKHYEEAILLYKKGLTIFNRFSGDEAALKAADTEGEIGIALLRWGKFSQAAPFLKNYVLKNKSIMGSDNTRLCAVHNRIGAEYLQVGRLNEALEQLETAKLLLPSVLKEIDDTIILSLNQNLAHVYKASGRLEEAIGCQKVALDTAMNSNHEEVRSLTGDIQKSLETLQQTHSEMTGNRKPKV